MFRKYITSDALLASVFTAVLVLGVYGFVTQKYPQYDVLGLQSSAKGR